MLYFYCIHLLLKHLPIGVYMMGLCVLLSTVKLIDFSVMNDSSQTGFLIL